MSDHAGKNESLGLSSVVTEIHAIMNGIIYGAEMADANTTFSYLADDPEAVFFQDKLHYSRDSLLSRFYEKYEKIQSQKFHITGSRTIVLGPESAVWVGYGTGQTEMKTGESVDVSFTETWVWQKIHGRWVATHYHG
ncbi:MAG: DUF4440 domain-containing protein [Methanoregula sp.]